MTIADRGLRRSLSRGERSVPPELDPLALRAPGQTHLGGELPGLVARNQGLVQPGHDPPTRPRRLDRQAARSRALDPADKLGRELADLGHRILDAVHAQRLAGGRLEAAERARAVLAGRGDRLPELVHRLAVRDAVVLARAVREFRPQARGPALAPDDALFELVADDRAAVLLRRVADQEQDLDALLGPDAGRGRIEVLDGVGPVELGLDLGRPGAGSRLRAEDIEDVVQIVGHGVLDRAVEDPGPLGVALPAGPVVPGIIALVAG